MLALAHSNCHYSLHKAERLSRFLPNAKEKKKKIELIPGMIVLASVLELERTGNGEVKSLTVQVIKLEAIVERLLAQVQGLTASALDF